MEAFARFSNHRRRQSPSDAANPKNEKQRSTMKCKIRRHSYIDGVRWHMTQIGRNARGYPKKVQYTHTLTQ